MRIINLTAENFKRLEAVEITPEGNIITIGGNNGQGKSSVLDAIWVALAGLSVAPPRPIREGAEKAVIKLDLGELMITRSFTQKEGERFTHNIKVADAEGRTYPSPQKVLDELLGEIGFDPFDFVLQKPEQQAETLMDLVPLSVDLDELAEVDKQNFEDRTIINRNIRTLEGQLAGIPEVKIPKDAPDRQALLDELGKAADTNTKISLEISRREQEELRISRMRDDVNACSKTIEQLEQQINDIKARKSQVSADADLAEKAFRNLDPIAEFVNTDALREKIREADEVERVRAQQQQRKEIVDQLEEQRDHAKSLTEALERNEKRREKALQEAEMPIEGLGFSINEKGKPVVTYEGLPFDKDQISTAAALRVSTAIAMAANPRLRVLRIKDGSLLDDNSMAMLAEMAEAEDYQLWIERVGRGGVGIVLEAGRIVETDGDE